MAKLKLGLILDRAFHEEGRWVSALTPRLIDELLERFDVCWIEGQSDYEQHLGNLDALYSAEPGWAAPKIEFSRTAALEERLARLPSYIAFSDPHANKWRERYFLDSGLGYVLGYYYHPTRYHFRRLPSERLIHFPWAIPDEWLGDGLIRLRAQPSIACFGASQHEAYTVRNWCKSFPFVNATDNSGVENKIMSDDQYIAWLGTLDAAIAAGSDDARYGLTTPKYFEIAAGGALLFAQQTEDLDRLGFRHQVNCLVFTRDDFEQLARDYLAHPEDFLEIRESGRELIRARHRLSTRLDALTHHIVETRETLARAGQGTRVAVPDTTPATSRFPESPMSSPAPPAPASSVRSQQSPIRPRILFVIDAPGWAHDFNTRNLARALGEEFEIVGRYQSRLTAEDLDAAELVFVYYWPQVELLRRLGTAFERNRHKLVVGICSHYELEGERHEHGLDVLRSDARAIFVNNLQLLREYAPLVDRPVFYTPNGVATDFYTPDPEPRPDAPMTVGWAGTLSSWDHDARGYHTLIVPAVERVEGAELHTANREDEWRDPPAMRAFYRALDVYVCASRAEGTPNPCLEAASCGVPLLTTRVGNMPQLVRHGVNGLLVERTVDALVAQLELLRESPKLRRSMGIRARAAMRDWDWQYQAQHYRTMIRSLLEQPPASTSQRTSGTNRSEQSLFRAHEDVYLASADQMDHVVANV
ncbi:MAG: glycosyltransferase, partial [Acidobacteriota bacterium]